MSKNPKVYRLYDEKWGHDPAPDKRWQQAFKEGGRRMSLNIDKTRLGKGEI
jgi:hypothetical protein